MRWDNVSCVLLVVSWGKNIFVCCKNLQCCSFKTAKGKYEMGQCELCVVSCKLGKKHIRVLQKSRMVQLQDAKGKYEMGV